MRIWMNGAWWTGLDMNASQADCSYGINDGGLNLWAFKDGNEISSGWEWAICR